MSRRWKAISPSQFPWEQHALDFIERALPDREPFRAYSNFEFVAEDGSINEVDLLIVACYTLFLVEIKSRPGEVDGDTPKRCASGTASLPPMANGCSMLAFVSAICRAAAARWKVPSAG